MKRRLADEYKVIVESPSPEDCYCYSPGIAVLPGGRLVATMDFGGTGVRRMPGAVAERRPNGYYQLGKIFLSDDQGDTWREVAQMPFMHMRPFVLGDALYVIGHHNDLGVARSDDWGETWTAPSMLTQGERWHQAPSNVCCKGDAIYLVMERMTHQRNGWPVCGIAPVLMRGRVGADLLKKENWTFASELVFDETIFEDRINYFGIPFLPKDDVEGSPARFPSGWLEANVVQLHKETDWLYDPSGSTFHIFMRCFTGGLPWTGAIAKVVEHPDGTMETMLEHAPSGKEMVFTCIPGGGLSKFHILYDAPTQTYWLLTSLFTDSYRRMETLPQADRHGYDRSALALYYSHNCFDWLPVGIVTTGGEEGGRKGTHARSYASMAIAGDDLLVLSRSGDARTKNGHDTNMITFHRVRDFRSLIDL